MRYVFAVGAIAFVVSVLVPIVLHIYLDIINKEYWHPAIFAIVGVIVVTCIIDACKGGRRT